MTFFTAVSVQMPMLAAAAFMAQLMTGAAWAQSSCSSDGQRPPVALIERFISADCETCWADPATVKAKPRELALDWIVPSPRGDDAALSAAASRDAPMRLQGLGRDIPKPASETILKDATTVRHPLPGNFPAQLFASLRVAHGVALGGYIGTSIELKTNGRTAALMTSPLTAWLLLVEEIPAGAEGTPVARNLVRNALMLPWNERSQLSNSEQKTPHKAMQKNALEKLRFYESRPMSIPTGANPDHLRVVGWVEDARGQMLAGAASTCKQAAPAIAR